MTGRFPPSSFGNLACRLRNEAAASASVFCEDSCTRNPPDDAVATGESDADGAGAVAVRVLGAGATGAGAACGSRESGPEPRVGDPGAATGLPLTSAPSGRMLRVCTFLGSFEPGTAELADCCGAAVADAGATGAGRTTRGAD